MALLALGACHRADPEGNKAEDLIVLQPSGSDVATKGFINAADLRTSGTTVKIYDVLTGFTGLIDGDDYDVTDEVTYIDDTLVYGTDWSFGSGAAWRWTRTGTHKFFGWLEEDAISGLSADDMGVTYYASSKTLSVPAIAFEKTSPQFDMSYSNVAKVNVESVAFNPNASVILPLNHLFSALAVTIQNNGGSDATIVSVEMENLVNKKSATINYSGDTPTLTLTPSAAAEQTNFLAHFVNKDFDQGGTKYDLVTGQLIASNAKGSYYMMWPQTTAEVGEVDSDGGIRFVVKYTYDGIYDEDGVTLHEYTATCYLAEAVNELKAGRKYAINLQFKGKSLEITAEVMPWDAKYYDLDYSKNTIQAYPQANNEGVLWLYTWEYDEALEVWRWVAGPRDRKITMDSGKSIKGDFTILSPISGRWQITTYPAEAAQYFTITPSSGSIESLVGEGDIFNGYVEFIISPNGNVPSIQKLYFNVDIEINGLWRNANSEFNRKNWELTRLP